MKSSAKGGVSRGPGESPLTWGEEDSLDASRFQPRALSPGEFEDAENRGLIGIGLAAPDVDAQHEAGGAAAIESSLGASPWRRRLAPRHRRAVRTLLGPSTTSTDSSGSNEREENR